jgi:UDP-glucose 4-epimerase
MSCVVTGVAGFIGSRLAEKLIERNFHVLGIDSFTDYYPRRVKESNIAGLRRKSGFEMIEDDINSMNLSKVLKSADYTFHLAAQPGVRSSWGTTFSTYVRENVLATQRLLEACKSAKVTKFVYSSSSSIYGDAEKMPTPEEETPMPISPYGVTKLAGEHLCRLYHRNFGVPVVVLRYFTAYGPGQRPDMAFNRFISRISKNQEVEVYGDGTQSRDFTFVDDITQATVMAVEAKGGRVFNVGSGRPHSIKEAISLIEGVVGKEAEIRRKESAAGDVSITTADISRIGNELGYEPRISFEDGIRRQVDWQLRTERGKTLS